jgi:hypothetical protein
VESHLSLPPRSPHRDIASLVRAPLQVVGKCLWILSWRLDCFPSALAVAGGLDGMSWRFSRWRICPSLVIRDFNIVTSVHMWPR